MDRPKQRDGVVLVADMIVDEGLEGIAERRDLERTDPGTLRSLEGAFRTLGLRWTHYGSPEELGSNAHLHRDDVVLTVYGGAVSRNRMGLVPAVCESFGLPFVGPDVYGRMVAQDKSISKRLAADAGLRTPAWRVVREPADLPFALNLPMPVVVKPLMEGSSMGITQANLAHTRHDAEAVCRTLLDVFGQPVVVERFVPGREVAFCAIARPEGAAWAFSEIAMRGDGRHFEDRLYDAAAKMKRHPDQHVRTIDEELGAEDRAAIERFLSFFGPYGYCRVDGRLEGGRFHFLEFTPDAWLGEAGQFAGGFINKGWTYPQVIAEVLASASPVLHGL